MKFSVETLSNQRVWKERKKTSVCVGSPSREN